MVNPQENEAAKKSPLEKSQNHENVKHDHGKISGEKKHEFLVGDFVWGKIRSYPWWPGQIYDPSDASECVAVSAPKDRLLVAFFGDASFAWCFPNQLVPFAEHFEELVKQKNSKRFVKAVDEALEEIGRRTESSMTCSCRSQEDRVSHSRLAAPVREPAEVLGYLRHVAQAVSVVKLELVRVKSWLSAFYRAEKRLPVYHQPGRIDLLGEKRKDVASDSNDFSVPIKVPILGLSDDESSSSSGVGTRKNHMLLSCERLNPRKHKNVAQPVGEDTDIRPKHRKKSKTGEETPAAAVKTTEKACSDAVIKNGTRQASRLTEVKRIARAAVTKKQEVNEKASQIESGKRVTISPVKMILKNSVGWQQRDGEITEVGSIKQQIKLLASMLEMCKSKISAEERSNLEDEIRNLLHTVERWL